LREDFSLNPGTIIMGQRRKDREVYWRGVLQQQAESGLNIAEFCRQESVSAPGFYAWRRKLKDRDAAESLKNGRAANFSRQLLPVRIESSGPSVPVRILLPQGVSIETPGTIDDGALTRLLHVVREATVC
jgi:hypothetical protein